MQDSPEIIGRVFGTEEKPNTAYKFTFWSHPNARVGIGTLVTVTAGEATIYGSVIEAKSYNDLESPLHEFMAHQGAPDLEPPTNRQDIRVYEAAVLRRIPEEPVGAVPFGLVTLADEADVRRALRTESYLEQYGIPAGCYGEKDKPHAVHVDSRFLLGPEAGHLNVTGTSGLAAKTSYVLFLLQSIFAAYKGDPEELGNTGVAAFIFNTKGGDLLFVDQPGRTDALTDDDRGMYAALGMTPGPFKNVRFYAPFENADDSALKTLRNSPKLDEVNPTRGYRFGLKEIVSNLEVTLTKGDLDSKADAYLQSLVNDYIEKESPIGDKNYRTAHAKTIDDLLAIVEEQIGEARANQGSFRGHHVFTMAKMRNRIKSVKDRFPGLVAMDGHTQGPFSQPLEHQTLYVIDVAKLSLEAQELVFAIFISELHSRMELGTLGVARTIVVVDELNKYVPSSGAENHIARALTEIASRGRYMGLTLFGAQQFRSRVDKEVVGNCASHAFGHIEAEELAQPGYSYFSPAVKEKLANLETGQVLLKHPYFGQPVFLRFPRPDVMKGGDGMREFPATSVDIIERIYGQVRRIDSTKLNLVKEKVGNMPKGDALNEVWSKLSAMKPGDDPMRALPRKDGAPVLVLGSSEEGDPFVSGPSMRDEY
ncbi:MAG: ATP-binding protein [Armatimonadetes bacterium]|nr:ATP-binding protein [Armatimonadota bacterium]